MTPKLAKPLKIISAVPLSEAEKKAARARAAAVFNLGGEVSHEFLVDPQILGGLILKTEEQILDLSLKGKLNGLRLGGDAFSPKLRGVGKIERLGDGVATVSGLPEAFLGETVENPEEGVRGLVLNLTEERAEIIILQGFERLREGLEVYATGRRLEIPGGEAVIGRVVNPLGEPLDGLGPVKTVSRQRVERRASGIAGRQPVGRPLQTGLKVIDALIPVGRGQRELIIGDRGTGKTAMALDTIINQKNNPQQPVFCFYVAIGQKKSKVAQLVAKLKEKGALAYTAVVVAAASDPVSWQYLAPYAGCALAEYFLDKGQDALVVYDDLTKHAWAYRELSLVLRRPPGREAYPGDIFYLHAKLLERAGQLSAELGGGSLTALPIIETQAGDVSAYIPTNVISITDGQIYLERELFHAGFRPAVNIGLSVSRVGGKAQVPLLKKLTGKLRLDLAQYRELSSFSQFAADLDTNTKKKLDEGEKLMELMKQSQYQTLTLEQQIILFWSLHHGFMNDVPISSVSGFESELLAYFNTVGASLLEELTVKGEMSASFSEKLKEALRKFKESHTYVQPQGN